MIRQKLSLLGLLVFMFFLFASVAYANHKHGEEDEQKLLPSEMNYLVFLDTFDDVLENSWVGDRQYFTTASHSLAAMGSYLSPISLLRPSRRLLNTAWEMGVRMSGSFSSETYLRIYLASDDANIKRAHKSYQLQISGDDGAVIYQLWHQNGSGKTLLYESKTAKESPSFFKARIRIACDMEGIWRLWLADGDNGAFLILPNTAEDGDIPNIDPLFNVAYTGIQFYYLPARQQDLLLDYFLMRKLGEESDEQIAIAHEEVIINELLSNPYSGGVEFVELFNRSQRVLDIGALYLARETNGRLEQFRPIARNGLLLQPRAYKVLSVNSEQIRQYYYTPDETALHEMNMPQINNNEGHILLVRSDSAIVDDLRYHSGMHSPFMNNAKGVSLEKIDPSRSSSESSNWASASSAAGYATPGYKNSQASDGLYETTLWLTSRTVSPDDDGFEDKLELNYVWDKEGVMANVWIYDDKGNVVKELGHAYSMGTEGIIVWDGFTYRSERAKMGLYILHLETYHIDGWRKVYKFSFAVAYRQ
ncbi:lamin tail domain-containing protein [Olivibacter sitiensis]|uniref:lamin tail domain-containing protein n=1 Tax=Olivibacter sitiensis TaxID=376470 RepID=UPI00146FAD83|nr:lamin tail domain-containing protein [Olivibacter sitiensis]